MSSVVVQNFKTHIPISLSEAKKWSNEDLHALAVHGAESSIYGLRALAVAYVVLRERGADVSAFPQGLADYYDRIAAGRVLPRLVLEYQCRPDVLKSLAGLVPEDQEKVLGAQARLKVAKRAPDGSAVIREKSPTECTPSELSLAVADGQIQPVEAQIRRLPKAREQVVTPNAAPSPAERETNVWGFLTAGQQKEIIGHAVARNQSVSAFIHDVLVQNKLIRGKIIFKPRNV